MHPITYLFVPGDRPERFDKAFASGADAVIIDLEDAVAEGDKAAARANVAEWLAHSPLRDRALIRVNAAGSRAFADDIRMLASAPPLMAMLAKADRAEDVRQLAVTLKAGSGVVAMIESARGIANVNEIAAAHRVTRLAFGALDYAADLGLSGDTRGLVHPSAAIALGSRLAGLPLPIAAPTPSLDDENAIAEDVRFAQALGFGAKLCIHPRQVSIVQRAFMPSAESIAWAERVVAAANAGGGAAQVDGSMVDKPVVERARAVLALSQRADSMHGNA